MKRPLEITGLTKTFSTPSGPFVAIKDFNARIEPGEFVCILGHSGCGKSTLLSIVAGLQQATFGGVCIELNRKQREKHSRKYMEMLGLSECYEQPPAELSLGTQQRVSLARAMSLEPRYLLLDEPFGMLDSLTRFDMQDTLLEVWEHTRNTVVMVTHDMDEALYLADRLLLMTDGPEATLGEIMTIPFARPRDRASVLEHRSYYALRSRIIGFLEDHALQSAVA